MLKACRASVLADRLLIGGDGAPRFASKRLRRRVLHQCSHMGAKTWGRIQLDRCCLVIRMPKLSYASERTTVVNLTPQESSGGGRGSTRRSDTGGHHPADYW